MTGRNAQPVPIGTRLMDSRDFKILFREGMSLVEEAAAYLDGPGRAQAKALPRAAGFAYAAESLRLVMRLMRMAAWLLSQRALDEGAIESPRIVFQTVAAGRCDGLPDAMADLVERSARIQERIAHLDAALHVEADPVGRRIKLIEEAFGRS